jgi:uncharacterized protein HemX
MSRTTRVLVVFGGVAVTAIIVVLMFTGHGVVGDLFGWPATWGTGGNMVAWVICGAIGGGWLHGKEQARHLQKMAQAARHHTEQMQQLTAQHLELRQQLAAHTAAIKDHVTRQAGGNEDH